MTHPAVWADAWNRAETACNQLDLPLKDILAQNLEDPEKPYVFFETSSATSDRFGLGEYVNEETGQIFLHLMMPRGGKTPEALTRQQVLSAAFRRMTPAHAEGLVYQGQSFDPPSADETGNWAVFTLSIDYIFQSRLMASEMLLPGRKK